MPIEINEIAIQMKVRDDAALADDAVGFNGRPLTAAEREALVADCVARVLAALKTRRER